MRLRLTCTSIGPDQEQNFLKKSEVFGDSLYGRHVCYVNGRAFLVHWMSKSLDGAEYACLTPAEPYNQTDLLREGWRIMLVNPFQDFCAREEELVREGWGAEERWKKEGF